MNIKLLNTEHEWLEWYNQHESKIIKAKDKVIKSLKGNKKEP